MIKEYKIDENTPTYSINMYLARNISKILFDNQYIICYNTCSSKKRRQNYG